MQNSPLLETSDLPLFSKIKPEDVLPSINSLISEAKSTIEALLERDQHTYTSLVEAREHAEDTLSKSWSVVAHLNAVANNQELRTAYNEGLPLLSDYGSEMGQNRKLYDAYRKLSLKGLEESKAKVIRNELLDFQLSGVALEGEAKTRFKEIEQELSKLTSSFSDNVLDATMAFKIHLESSERLQGLPENAKDLLEQNAKQANLKGWLITLDMPSYLAVMTFAEDRDLRQQLNEAYLTRASELGPHGGEYNNGPKIEEILSLRLEKSRLLGFESYAELSLKKKMAKSTDEVVDLMSKLVSRTKNQARKELEELCSFAKKVGIKELQSWDLAYVSEKLKEARYEFKEEEVKPYFPLEKVLEGMFTIASKLFSTSFKQVHDFDTWHEDVRLYEVFRENKRIARFFLDPFARMHKRGGAWMDTCRDRQQLEGTSLQEPVAYLVCNSSPPIGKKPSLMTHDEVTTLFHEFGHGLHHMLTEISQSQVSGINGVAWDAVELPSQFMENWCWQEEAMPLFSSHFETGEALPTELLDKMLAAKNFQSGMQMLRQLEFSLFDFKLHMEHRPLNQKEVQDLLNDVRREVSVTPIASYNRFQNSFSHIFSGGYAAGYYSYKWAEVLSADAFSKFESEGIFNSDTGETFRREILAKGGVKPAEELFSNFMGRAPTVDALLRHCGIQN
jgi:oligopeptidase A